MKDKREKYAIFTVDVEEFSDTECIGYSGASVAQDMLDGLDEYICLLDRYHIKATMFAITDAALKQKERIRAYLRRGHRLALHGHRHVAPCLLEDEEFRAQTIQAKAELEKAFGAAITGYRAACFGMDDRKLEIVKELGFRYDSSMMKFQTARHVNAMALKGFRKLRRDVYRNQAFFEFGMSTQRFFWANYPVSGGGYVRLGRWPFIIPMIRHYIRDKDIYVFYLHPFEFSQQKMPKIHSLRLYDRFYLYSGRRWYQKKVEKIIKMLKADGYRFITFDQLADRLEER